MYLFRRFREISKKESKATFIKNAHINSIDGDVFGGPLAVYAKKVVVRKVPVEVWEAIVFYCADPQALALNSFLPLPNTAQHSMGIVLSQVCWLFRNIALSTPSLWSRLDLSLPIDQFNMFIKRSSQSPLIIYHSNTNKFTLPPTHIAAFQSIQHRIVRIETSISFYDLVRLQMHKFCRLQYLVCNTEWGPSNHNLRDTLSGCKELKSLAWHSTFQSSPRTSFSGSAIYGLTNLSLLLQLQETFVLDLLRCCPWLESVSLQTVGPDEIESQQMVPLSHLKSLDLSLYNYSGWLLKIQGPTVLDDFCLHHVDTLYTLTNLFKSPFWVVSLNICCDIGSYFILPWLENEPGVLKKLTLSVIPIWKLQDYLFFLKWRGGSMRCTRLEELRLVYKRRGRKRNESDLLEVYTSRCRAGLKPLHIVWGDKLLQQITVDGNDYTEPYATSHPNPSRVRWISVRHNRRKRNKPKNP